MDEDEGSKDIVSTRLRDMHVFRQMELDGRICLLKIALQMGRNCNRRNYHPLQAGSINLGCYDIWTGTEGKQKEKLISQ